MKKLLIFSLFLVFSCTKDSDTNEAETTPETLYNIGVSAEQGGSVNTSGGDYPLGTVISIEATADSGYEFNEWTGNASGSDNPLSYTVEGDATITATFSEISSVDFANISVTEGVNMLDLYSDLIIVGNVEIESKGIYLDGEIFTEDSGQNSIEIERDNLEIREYEIKFFVQTPNGIIESDVYNATPYEGGYVFQNLSHTLNSNTTVADLSVSFNQNSPNADLGLIEKGFYLAKKTSELSNNKFISSTSGNQSDLNVNTIDSSSTYYYQAFITDQYGTYTSEILSFNTRFVVGDSTLGGKVIYVDATGFHGVIIADIEYLSPDELQWSTEYGVTGSYFKSSEESYGKREAEIVLNYFESNAGNSPAADYCDNIVIEGIDDWYLPNFTELSRAKKFADFPEISLWSSNENANNSSTDAIYHYGANFAGPKDKKERYRVIPVRKF